LLAFLAHYFAQNCCQLSTPRGARTPNRDNKSYRQKFVKLNGSSRENTAIRCGLHTKLPKPHRVPGDLDERRIEIRFSPSNCQTAGPLSRCEIVIAKVQSSLANFPTAASIFE
jgi:hypothetical protein